MIQEALNFLAGEKSVEPSIESPEKIIRALTDFIEPIRQYIGNATDKNVAEKFSRKFGEGGVAEYFYNLCEIIHKKNKDFGGEDFKKFKEREADARVQQADDDVSDLQSAISEVVIETLKKIHGTNELRSGEKAYWDVGIESPEIKQEAYRKQQSVAPDKRAPKEAYVDLIDFEKILKQKNNWDHFEQIFNIALPDEKRGSKKHHLSWLTKLNEIRRISAHKSPYRQYSDEDLDFVTHIKAELYDRFTKAGFNF